MKITIRKLKCKRKRCGHEWAPRVEKVVMCPKCKSRYFNIPPKIVEKYGCAIGSADDSMLIYSGNEGEVEDGT